MIASSSLNSPAGRPGALAGILALWLAVFLPGCSLTPGMDMKKGSDISDATVPVMKDGKLVKEKVNIVPITADLIIERENARLQDASKLSLPSSEAGPYRVGLHDRLQITVWDHPELNDPGGEKILPELAGKAVGDDGTIFYPYIGTIHVADKTVSEIRDLLSQGLSKYFKKVKLDVRVISFQAHKVNVVGEVKYPGVQSMVDTPLNIAEAISRAGGVTAEADLSHVTLSRGDKLYPINLQALYEQGNNGQNLQLMPGDVLNVPDRYNSKVFVTGEVGRQQSLQIHKGKLTLAQAISEANGVDFNTSNAEEIYIIRAGQAKPEIFQLNGESPDAMILAEQFSLKPHDIVFVGTAGVTQWSRVLNQLLPSSFSQVMTRGAFYGF
ncbi:polysaccharide biosynthesis/export family protein [Methylocaldum sp.]|uniref:polysaccharide biosynthesis/export family protein n=1 Tax=Methylocaldum sp. TaxID=1969727 RepID=UPI002D58AD39|nr:polysaccharide biosynthesis/export family protein [Methylocaldum sp.]HYE36431.1 polysaccharide biosynthesis/export family protein [Methylocaldum sp.]